MADPEEPGIIDQANLIAHRVEIESRWEKTERDLRYRPYPQKDVPLSSGIMKLYRRFSNKLKRQKPPIRET